MNNKPKNTAGNPNKANARYGVPPPCNIRRFFRRIVWEMSQACRVETMTMSVVPG
ncbi:MAG: hypothetical protein ABIJ53_09350 [Verrucomicrobiota bacterium]